MLNIFKKKNKFQSADYWEERYSAGGNSGSGSYNHLASFKAEVINELISDHGLASLIEFGCGDGNQLGMLQCAKYVGLDVSATALQICKSKYKDDKTKNFFLYNPDAFVDRQGIMRMDASMSLDVLYHLVEQSVYEKYLIDLFASASKVVIVYAADVELKQVTQHELYRKFTNDITRLLPDWKLLKSIKNKYPAKNYEDQEGSLADFFIYTPAK